MLQLANAKRQLGRGAHRVNAEIRRPLSQAHSALRGNETNASLYQSLPQGQIRLLTIQIADDDTAQCRLDTYLQHLAPRYDAVSYSWGDDNTPAYIHINGLVLEIRKSLLAFLKASTDRRPPLRPLWIDAICLNQGDNDEKAVQIPLMDQIYRHASRTIVWLAKDGNNVDLVDKEHYPREWAALSRYFQRPWFHRLWVLQEVLLSENIEVLCSAGEIKFLTWKELSNFGRFLEKHDAGINLITDDNDAGVNLENGSLLIHNSISLMKIAQNGLRRFGYVKMSELQFDYHARRCYEPVDRVWGLLGLLSPKLVAKVRESKIIDYSEIGRRDYWKSYLAFMKLLYAFDVDDFFTLITWDISRKGASPLPSWCVDFNASALYAAFRRFRKFRAGFVDLRDRTAIESSLDLTESTLRISGFYLDEVTSVTAIHEPLKFPDVEWQQSDGDLPPELAAPIQACLQWLLECNSLSEATLGLSSRAIGAMCHTLLATDNQHLDYMEVTDRTANKGKQSVDSILGEAYLAMLAVLKAMLHNGTEPVFFPDEFFARFRQACRSRRLFATKGGRIGLGPPDLQTGDRICAFVGAGTLFAVRQVRGDGGFGVQTKRHSQLVGPPDDYRLIGDAYMHGLMFGEAFTAAGRGPTRDYFLV